MKKVGWFFGDSFTWGMECHPHDEYYKYTIDNIGKRWTELVSENLNIIENNLGINGASNLEIINTIIQNIKYINKGDYVFIGNTLPMRFQIPDITNNKISSINNCRYKWKNNEYEVIYNYTNMFVIPFEDMWEKYYTNQYLNLKTIIRDKGANVLFWKHSKWGEYEIIKDETNNKIDDLHWTWDSHRKMAYWVLNNLKSNII
jgi:hypothetical protein